LLNAEHKKTVEDVFWGLFKLMPFDHIRTESSNIVYLLPRGLGNGDPIGDNIPVGLEEMGVQ
jgi:hypothetical protein